jgi:N-acetylmuramoyl-L-alanine amidase
MLVFSRKKIRYAILSLFAIVMILVITLSLKEENKKSIDTVSLPVSGKVVVVDAGHGVPGHPGAHGRQQRHH